VSERHAQAHPALAAPSPKSPQRGAEGFLGAVPPYMADSCASISGNLTHVSSESSTSIPPG
jgi:hypothetical protein